MTKKELEQWLNKEPFRPFRVNVADGKHYDITNPRLVVPTDTRLFIVFDNEGWTDVVLRHITSVETMAAA